MFCSHLPKRPRQEISHVVWMTVDFIVNRHDAIYSRQKTLSCRLHSVWPSLILEIASYEYDNQHPFSASLAMKPFRRTVNKTACGNARQPRNVNFFLFLG